MLTLRDRTDQTVRMSTATEVSVLTVALYLLDLAIKVVMCVSRSLTTDIRRVEDHYRSLCRKLTLAEWRRRPLRKRYIDNVMRLTSALQ